MPDIFISHIHEHEALAMALLQFIRNELGQSTAVFLSSDTWQIHAGEIWLDRIREELASAKIVVLLLNEESVKRPWVNFEAGAAWITKKIIIPVCFGGITKASLPKPYSNIQALDLEDDNYYLIRSIHQHLGPTGVRFTTPPPTTARFGMVKAAIDSLKHGGEAGEKKGE